jgi:hypothetical protein
MHFVRRPVNDFEFVLQDKASADGNAVAIAGGFGERVLLFVMADGLEFVAKSVRGNSRRST